MTKKFNYVVATVTTLAMLASAAPAFAYHEYDGSSTDNSIYVSVSNSGSITNTTKAEAETGGNWAGGSYGGAGGDCGDCDGAGDGGAGGDANSGGEEECYYDECHGGGGEGDANGGDGGNGGDANGGNGGAGGLVSTGDAEANAGTVNTLNTTDIEIEGCGCDDDNGDYDWYGHHRTIDNSVDVTVSNSGSITNKTKAEAKTGENNADGSFGGEGGKAGDGGEGGSADSGNSWYGHGGGEANGGDGGNGGDANGGDGDLGGTVLTGWALANSGSINVMNTTLLRITR